MVSSLCARSAWRFISSSAAANSACRLARRSLLVALALRCHRPAAGRKIQSCSAASHTCRTAQWHLQ